MLFVNITVKDYVPDKFTGKNCFKNKKKHEIKREL